VPGGGRPGGFVSLRVAAADAGGSAVDETIVHAWLLALD
jgi:hypothetical protein